MVEIQARGTGTVGFGDLDHEHRLKPTSVFALLEQVLPDIWEGLAGMSREAYFAAHPVRLVFSHLRIERTACRLSLDERVGLAFDGQVGRYPGRDGAPRHGLKDRFTVRAADGTPALRWTAEVLWVGMDGDRAAGFLGEPAPGLRHDQSTTLEPPPARPDLDGSPTGEFRWTPRETDFNRHVYFASYLERAENALTDAGHDVSGLASWDLWFSRPAFAGERMTVTVDATDAGHVVGLRRDDGTVCATVLAR